MLKPTKTNELLKYTAYAIVILSGLAALLFFISADDFEFMLRFIIGCIIFIHGAFGALFLFAISEGLNRLQEIEYNTERSYKRAEQYYKDWERKTSS